MVPLYALISFGSFYFWVRHKSPHELPIEPYIESIDADCVGPRFLRSSRPDCLLLFAPDVPF